MKFNKFICLIYLIAAFFIQANAAVMQGGITENEYQKGSTVYDSATKLPVSGAKISIPHARYTTYTDNYGRFSIPQYIKPNTILSVQKENYKPFSITITDKNINKAMRLSIEKTDKSDIIIDTSLYHIGDDNYSMSSANAGQFRLKSAGPVYRKNFLVKSINRNKKNYLVIGSIIGIDTALARGMGQNRITTSYASAPVVYFNGTKIAEIQINGDNQRIIIPNYLIKSNQYNEVKIQAGVNLSQTAYLDYDDIEFMNLNIE